MKYLQANSINQPPSLLKAKKHTEDGHSPLHREQNFSDQVLSLLCHKSHIGDEGKVISTIHFVIIEACHLSTLTFSKILGKTRLKI